MSGQKREIFLTALLAELRSQHSAWRIDDHYKIEWAGHPRNAWPEADIVIDMQGRRFIVEYDEDSDPGRSLVKYWPILHQAGRIPMTIIEVWKRGTTIGHGQAELTKWMGARFEQLHPSFSYKFIERKEETATAMAQKVAEIVEAAQP